MEHKIWKRNFIGTAFWIVMLVLVLTPFLGAIAAAENQWQGVVRPGFMAGDSTNETDSFLDVFIPVLGNEKGLIFFNPNLRVDDKSSKEQNIGFGGRLLVDNKFILGANLYYDAMESSNNNQYQQWGVGFEALSKWFDLRGNYYKPFGETKHKVSSKDVFEFGPTSLLQFKKYEEAFAGYDAEAGVLVPFISNYVETRAYAGAYWYESDLIDDSKISGEKFRLEVRPLRFIDLSVEVWQDDMRGTDTFAGGYVEIPFDLGDLFAFKNPFKVSKNMLERGTRPLRDRMTEKVLRDRHIRAREHQEDTGSRYTDVIYVNSDNPDGSGSGTLNDPYTDINDIESNSRYDDGAWIYVFSTDDEADVYDNTNITLLSDMVLWGQAFEFNGLGGDGPMPVLDGGGAGSVITLGTDDYDRGFTVAGLAIQNGEYGIYGSNIKSANIYDTAIRGNGTGVYIDNSFADTNISALNLNFVFANNEVYDNAGSGIHVANSVVGTGSVKDVLLTTNFENNLTHGNAGSGIYVNNYVEAPLVENVVVANSLSHNSSALNGSGAFLNNMIYSYDFSSEKSLLAAINNSSITNTFDSNIISENSSNGVELDNMIFAEVDGGGAGEKIEKIESVITNSNISNTFLSNTVEDNLDNGIYLSNNRVFAFATVGADTIVKDDVSSTIDASSITNTFTGNSVNGNMSDGVRIQMNALYTGVFGYAGSLVEEDMLSSITTSSIANNFTDNTVNGNDRDGVYIFNNVIEADVFAEGTEVNGNVMTEVLDTTIDNTFASNAFEHNKGDGVEMVYNGLYSWVYLYDSSNVKGSVQANNDTGLSNTFDTNMMNANGGYGYKVKLNYEMAEVDLFGSNVDGDVSSVIVNTDILNTFNANTIDSNTLGGMSQSRQSYLYALNLIFSSTVGSNVLTSVEQSGISNVLEANHITGNGGDGVFNAGSLITADFMSYGGSVSGAISSDVSGTSIDNTFEGNTIDSNLGDGLEARASELSSLVYVHGDSSAGIADISQSSINESYNKNTVTNNGGNGVLTTTLTSATTSDDSLVNLLMSGNTVTGNNFDGVDVTYFGGGTFTGDLGGGSLGSTGENSLHGNNLAGGYFDVDNNTGVGIMAEGNWWGMDANPVAAGLIDGNVGVPSWVSVQP